MSVVFGRKPNDEIEIKAGAFRAPETSERGAGTRTREQSDRENAPDPNERAEGERNASAEKKGEGVPERRGQLAPDWRAPPTTAVPKPAPPWAGATVGSRQEGGGAGDPRPRSKGRGPLATARVSRAAPVRAQDTSASTYVQAAARQ